MAETTYRLERFLRAQEEAYGIALSEIRQGRKQSHWVWFIFPQLKALGHSPNALYFGLAGLEEARCYLAHPVLRARLEEISEALLALDSRDPEAIMGYPDVLKLRSCMTLFACAAGPGSVYERVLEAFYGGSPDTETLRLIGGCEA